jgi:hypothetical protein
METISLRIPVAWEGRLSSRTVRGWLTNWLYAQRELPADPGAGDGRVSLLLPEREVAAFDRSFNSGSVGANLRRLIESHLGDMEASRTRDSIGSQSRFEADPRFTVEPTPWIVPGSVPTQYFRTWKEYNAYMQQWNGARLVTEDEKRMNRGWAVTLALAIAFLVIGVPFLINFIGNRGSGSVLPRVQFADWQPIGD